MHTDEPGETLAVNGRRAGTNAGPSRWGPLSDQEPRNGSIETSSIDQGALTPAGWNVTLMFMPEAVENRFGMWNTGDTCQPDEEPSMLPPIENTGTLASVLTSTWTCRYAPGTPG